MHVTAWHAIDAAEMAGVYEAEAARWRDGLAWETDVTWAMVEQSRQRVVVPGFVARDRDGRICGWSFYLQHRQTLQIGAVNALCPDATRALVGAVLDSAEARRTDRAMAFTLAGAPELDACLRARGFTVGTYRYLQRTFTPVPGEIDEPRPAAAAQTLRTWRTADAPEVTRVLAAAYADVDRLRPFGGDGRLEDWSEYLLQLTTETGCGRFCGSRSVIAEGTRGIDGAALVTDLGGRTSHLAQLIVAPPVHGSGLGRRMLSAAMRDASRAGFERMTLLVSEKNHVARSLYDRLGFQERATFVTAAN
jgi:ribosomal protein S18 acetylase RimI-like enzyme